jgi:hypothetical protein
MPAGLVFRSFASQNSRDCGLHAGRDFPRKNAGGNLTIQNRGINFADNGSIPASIYILGSKSKPIKNISIAYNKLGAMPAKNLQYINKNC